MSIHLTLTGVMNEMADSMTAANASRRQVSGIAQWADMVTAAEEAARIADWYVPWLGTVPGSRTHRRWMESAAEVIAELGRHATEADVLAAQARDDAGNARDTARAARAEERAHLEAQMSQDARRAGRRAADAEAKAARLEDKADACDAWQAAALDAAAYGRHLTESEDQVHAPVGIAYADAGGRAWIAGDKTFLSGGE